MYACARFFCGMCVIVLMVGAMGCGTSSSSSSGGGTSMDALASQVDAQNAAKKQQDEAAKKAAADQQAAAAAAAAAAQNPPQPERKAVGSREIVQGGGYYSAIMGARRHVMNVVDNIAWIQGVRNFQGTYGRKPKDTKEFMNVCVKENDLQLPRIEADEEYMYDPNGESNGDFGQLYVVKKESAAGVPAPSVTAPGAPATAK
jgi:hypothetical protein